MNQKHVDLLVIGAGPAGLAAAIAAREDGIESLLVLERELTVPANYLGSKTRTKVYCVTPADLPSVEPGKELAELMPVKSLEKTPVFSFDTHSHSPGTAQLRQL